MTEFLQKWIKKQCRNPTLLDRIFDFIFLQLSAPLNPGNFDSHPSRIKINRLSLRETLKNTLLSEQKVSESTFCRDKVRSKEEQLVADWLFLHRVPYKYAVDYKGYKPTFTLDGAFLDLVTMNANETSIYGASYAKNIKWRRRLHTKERTVRIEMRSCE